MRIAVHGAAGRMGRLVIKNAYEEGLTIAQAFDINMVGKDAGELAGIGRIGVEIDDDVSKIDCDVAIDFSAPQATMNLLENAAKKNVKVVIGTTGFDDEQKRRIEEFSKKIPIIISPNFSIGVNIFWKALEFLAEKLSDYDVEIFEIHHKFKRDSPSGTAIKAAEIIKEKTGKDKLIFCREGLREENEIGVFGIRGGDVVGEHTVLFIGIGERIELTHRAWNREAFSKGAIKAAKWIYNVSEPGLFSMSDIL